MERFAKRAIDQPLAAFRTLFAVGPIDRHSAYAALSAGVGYYLLAYASLEFSRFDGALASIWFANAAAVAFLLRVRVSSEIPLFIAIYIASLSANAAAGVSVALPAVYSLANIIDLVVVVGLTRRACGLRPDMANLEHLARFVWAGGVVGPTLSAAVATFALGLNTASPWSAATGWFLTDSMCMILIVPTVLLIADALQVREAPPPIELTERTLLLVSGVGCAFMVFYQPSYPLLFLIPPITLLHAFRLGSLGTALFVALLASLTTAMTWHGMGPIVQASDAAETRMHLLQAFLTANFLTGLPVAAILAGREKMMAELEDGRRELSVLADNTTDALMCFDLRGICTYASPSFEDVLGEPPQSFIGCRSFERMHPEGREQVIQAERRLLNGETSSERFTYRRFHDSEDGKPVFIEADYAVAYIPETGERSGLVCAARDVTDRVELEMQLTSARKKAEKAATAKSEFLANMSHEIRTPMNGVLGFAEMLLQSDLDLEQRRNADLIVQSGRSMMLLLNDILDLSKVEAGQISIHKQPADLNTTIEECAALHRLSAEKKGLELHFTGFDGPLWVSTDGLRVRQIVLNLIANAVKFTESGRISVECQTRENQIIVQVTDTGIGISADRIKKIFQPFTQGENDTARRFGGTGLGLSISHQLAMMLGGSIDVESEPGIGSCFGFTLPWSQVEEDPETGAQAEAGTEAEIGPKIAAEIDAGHPPPSFSSNTAREGAEHDDAAPCQLAAGSRILLVEDHDVNRILMTEMLERCGQDVSIAHDGNEAISMVMDAQLRQRPYDLILMDLQMPACDGYEATRTIRGEGMGGDQLPIIALTANAFPEDIAAARDAGMQAHLSKPLEFSALARALQRWLPTQIVELAEPPLSEPSQPEPSRTELAETEPLKERWNARRAQAIRAIRNAVDAGTFAAQEAEELTNLTHKLAGTAALFGEVELGDKAAALERALRMQLNTAVQAELARELLEIAENGAGAIGKGQRAPGGQR
ncbi:MAG: ATP-binding protein [Erythrobacter sp.]